MHMGASATVVSPQLPDGSHSHILVVFERGRGGEQALRRAAELHAEGAELHIVTLAPQADPSRCCGPGPAPFNSAVREQARAELLEARAQLPAGAERVSFTALVGCPSPPLADWAAAHDFDLILLPAQGLTRRRRARTLRRASAAEIRLT